MLLQYDYTLFDSFCALSYSVRKFLFALASKYPLLRYHIRKKKCAAPFNGMPFRVEGDVYRRGWVLTECTERHEERSMCCHTVIYDDLCGTVGILPHTAILLRWSWRVPMRRKAVLRSKRVFWEPRAKRQCRIKD